MPGTAQRLKLALDSAESGLRLTPLSAVPSTVKTQLSSRRHEGAFQHVRVERNAATSSEGRQQLAAMKAKAESLERLLRCEVQHNKVLEAKIASDSPSASPPTDSKSVPMLSRSPRAPEPRIAPALGAVAQSPRDHRILAELESGYTSSSAQARRLEAEFDSIKTTPIVTARPGVSEAETVEPLQRPHKIGQTSTPARLRAYPPSSRN